MLKVENVNLFYGAAQALRGVSITAEIGKVTCVLGRNGVGKSSLMRAIVGHQPIRSGRIEFEGEDLTPMPAYVRARKGLAYVPQGREIFPLLTVRENLQTGLVNQPRDARVIDPEMFTLFPILSEMLGRRGGDLSGGQQQQLAIARALLTKPKLLILDEPTEGIQPSIIRDIGPRHRISAPAAAASRSCWSSNISNGRAISPTITPCLTAAPWCWPDRARIWTRPRCASAFRSDARKPRARPFPQTAELCPDLVNGVAALIDERDRESLEVTLARVTFELSGARKTVVLARVRAFGRDLAAPHPGAAGRPERLRTDGGRRAAGGGFSAAARSLRRARRGGAARRGQRRAALRVCR